MAKKKQMVHLLDERAERITQLEQRVDMLEQLVDGYKNRELSAIEALKHANEAAKTRMIRADAEANQIVTEARMQANQHLATARDEGSRIVDQAKKEAKAYENMLDDYNDKIESNAAILEAYAKNYAAFIKEHKIRFNEVPGDRTQEESVQKIPIEELEEPQDDPKALIHNIYKLQNRSIPTQEDEQVSAAALTEILDDMIADLGPHPVPIEELPDPEPAPTPVAAPDPFEEPEQEKVAEPEREWVRSDESEKVPYVSEVIPDIATQEDISLDALLDEIIAAGDI